MNILVVGCGRVGAELAYRLFKQGHKVTVLDVREEAFAQLPHDFRGRTLWGEALSQEMLRRAGIEQADGIAVVTSHDATNVTVGHIAREKFNVPNVIVRIYDARNRPLFDEFDLQGISSTSWGAQRIEELLYHRELRSIFSAGNGEVELYEFTVPPNWDGRRLGDLMNCVDCTATALTRAGRAVIPTSDNQVKTGDVILVSATLPGVVAMRKRLSESFEKETR